MTDDRIWALIPAAGESRRFRDAGHRAPKPLLRVRHPELGDRTMLGHVLDSLPDELPRLVALPHSLGYDPMRGEAGSPLFVRKTEGQAHTIAQMCEWFPRDTAALVVNCDVVFREEDLRLLVSRLRTLAGGDGCDMVIAVAKSEDPAMSYAEPFPVPTRFYEKEIRPSLCAMTGAWAFSSTVELVRAFELARKSGGRITSEVYLSHAMNHYRGSRLAVELPAPVDFGTPEAVAACGAEVMT